MSRRQHLMSLRSASPVILPSMLQCDFGDLRQEVRRLEEAGTRAFHLDVMDGHFVPNFTYGMPLVAALRKLTDRPLDVHLMMVQPDRYLDAFYEAGADAMTVHLEAFPQPREAAQTLQRIRELGAAAGLAINPATPIEAGHELWDQCDLILVMSVPAGFGGQSFQDVALDKLRRLRQQIPPETLLEVDGGISEQTIAACAAAGAQLFVVGSAIFRQAEYGPAMRALTQLARIT